MNDQVNQERRYPTLTPPDKDCLEALIWLSQQPQAKAIVGWLLQCSAAKDDLCRKAESTPLFRAQGANQVLLDLLEYIAAPGEYKKIIDQRALDEAARGPQFMRNPLHQKRWAP